MKSTFATWLGLAATLSACTPLRFSPSHDALPLEKGTKDAYGTIHQLETDQAADVWSRMGWHDAQNQPMVDYAVRVYTGGPVIGSLLEGEGANLVSNTACKPANAPDAGDINVFSSYDISGTLAVQIGLPIPQVPIGATANRENTSSYSFEGAKMTLLPSDDLDSLLKTSSCAKRIAQIKGSGWIVRGLITAKRSYSFYRKVGGGVALSIPNATNSVTGANSIKGYGTDLDPRVYFMILKPVGPNIPQAVVSEAAPTTKANDCSGTLGSKIYIQRDASDREDVGVNVRQALQDRFDVVKQIQAVNSDHMPSTTQVRYFNSDDKTTAQCIAETLKANGYASPRTVMLNIASPRNQFEVWLTRSKSGS